MWERDPSFIHESIDEAKAAVDPREGQFLILGVLADGVVAHIQTHSETEMSRKAVWAEDLGAEAILLYVWNQVEQIWQEVGESQVS